MVPVAQLGDGVATDRDAWDAIVVGSGMGGLACAAALAKGGRAVLVLEQHAVPGGLTQTFARGPYRWDVGLHYLGAAAPGGELHALLLWLAGTAITFTALEDARDIAHFPAAAPYVFARSAAGLRSGLKQRFPGSAADIDAFLLALMEAHHAGKALLTERALPGPLAGLHELWHLHERNKWWGRSSAQVLTELIRDPKLRAVLLAQKSDYGGQPASRVPFGLQALVMRQHLNGAYYPVGGAGAFARALLPAITQGGGQVRTGSAVSEFLLEDGAVTGVQLADGQTLHAPAVVSTMGASNTVRCLRVSVLDSGWVREILSFVPSACHVALYLGLEGDVRAGGASASNHWFHESWDIEADLWQDPAADAIPPSLQISFPSMKDPAQAQVAAGHHTAVLVALTRWEPFAAWADSLPQQRPVAYLQYKAAIERNLMAQFARHFPALAPLVVARHLSTPLTTAAYIGAPRGAIHGLELSSRRFLSDSLRTRTPLPGLYLAGQDVTTPGIAGAMLGGMLAAASIAPELSLRIA